MSPRPLLISMALFVVLAGIAFFLLRKPAAPEAKPFFALAHPTPDTLVVIRGPDSTVVVPGGRTGWRVIAPVEDAADGLVVDAMVERLRNLPVIRRFPLNPNRLDTYGLRLTRGRIRALYADGTPPDTLIIGGFTIDAAQDYVRSGSTPEVGLVDARISRTYLLKETLVLRDTRLFPFHESRAVWFQGRDTVGRATSEAFRDSTGAWILVTGYRGRTDTGKIDDYLSSVAHMHIDSFAAESLPPGRETGLDPAQATFRVALESGDTLFAALGDSVPGEDLLLASMSGRDKLLRVSRKYLPVLLADLNRYRDPVVLPFGLSDLDSVAADFGARGRWSWTSSEWTRVEKPGPGLRTALESWILTRAEDFRQATPEELRSCGMDPPLGRLRWWGGGKVLGELEIGRTARDGRLPVRRAGGDRPRGGEILMVPLPPAAASLDVLSTGRLKLQPRN